MILKFLSGDIHRLSQVIKIILEKHQGGPLFLLCQYILSLHGLSDQKNLLTNDSMEVTLYMPSNISQFGAFIFLRCSKIGMCMQYISKHGLSITNYI